MNRFFILLIFLILVVPCSSQDLVYVRHTVTRLASPAMHGRGYVHKGDKKAACFVRHEFRKINLQPFTPDYFQYFSFPVNTFPGKMVFKAGKQRLHAGSDYLISCSSPGIRGTFGTVYPDDVDGVIETELLTRDTVAFKNKFIILRQNNELLRDTNLLGARGIIFLTGGPLSWRVSNCSRAGRFVVADVLKSGVPDSITGVTLNIRNRYYPSYTSQNVIGYLTGSVSPDTWIVFTAHYDHLGKMGCHAYFPGAHDNASGVAMMLDLARHYARPENRPACSMAFIAFGGEELGLVGSEYYTEHPLFPLENIKFLINLDLMSTGSEGIMVENGTGQEKEFNTLVAINDTTGLLKAIKKRVTSPNSDQYYFYKKGVPSVFIYTLGKEYSEYHTVRDKAAGLPFTAYDPLFLLIEKFITAIEKQ